MNLEDRKGHFTLALKLATDDPLAFMAVMGRCIILDARFNICNATIDYTALSKLFDECSAGEVPTYQWTVTPHNVTAKKIHVMPPRATP